MANMDIERRPGWVRIYGVILMLVGLALLVGGMQLVVVGGSWYYLIAGALTIASGVMLWRWHPLGVWLYLAVVIGTLIWAFAETGGFFWGLVPRLAPVLVLGLIAALAGSCLWAAPRSERVWSRIAAGVQAVLLVIGGMSLFSMHGEILGSGRAAAAGSVPAVTDANSKDNRWAYYGRDADNTRFAPFNQITPENVGQLEVAWTYRTGAPTGGPNEDQNTPIQVGDMVYLCTPLNKVIALDAETGQERWTFDPQPGDTKAWNRCRGVAYYEMPAADAQPLVPLTPATDGAAAASTVQPVVPAPAPATESDTSSAAAPVEPHDPTENRNIQASPGDKTADAPAALAATDSAQETSQTAPAGAAPDTTTTTTSAAAAAPTGPACDARIVTTAKNGRLYALDARTGELCPTFGDQGQVDLSVGLGPYPDYYYMPTSQPLIAGHLAVIGGWVWDGRQTEEPSGVVRAYDLRTGELVWAWDLGNPDITKLPPEGQTYTHGTPNYWSTGSYDPELDMIYLPLGNATPDFWGAHRTDAMNRYASSVVALKASTGREVWHFQGIHMDTWDYDVGTPPALMEVPDGQGAQVPALVLGSKTHQLFLLDRRDGKPLAQVEERPVPQAIQVGDAPASPTQPFSVGMPQVAPMELHEKDMWGATMFDQLYCRIQFRKLRYEGPYTKLTTQPTLIYPGYYGGFNWGGFAYDPQHQLLLVNDMRMPQQGFLSPQPEAKEALDRRKSGDRTNASWATHLQDGTPYQSIRGAFNSFLGLPCHQPSWGNLTAIDMRTRQIAWQVPLGTVEDSRMFGMRFSLPLPVGMPSLSGPFATAGGLVFYAGTQDYYLRAFETATGKEIWKSRLPVGAQATPMTYLSPSSGRQFVVVSAGGARMTADKGDYVIAYALPRR